jgi:hypothetical protein
VDDCDTVGMGAPLGVGVVNLTPGEEVFDGDSVDGHAGDVAIGDVDTAEVAIGEFAAGQVAVFEFHGAHGGAFGVVGVAFGGHADVVDIGASELGAFDLKIAEVGVDDLHVAGVYVIDDGSGHHDVFEVAVAEGAFGEFRAFEVEFSGFDAGGGVVDANLFHGFFCKYKDYPRGRKLTASGWREGRGSLRHRPLEGSGWRGMGETRVWGSVGDA